MISYLSPREIEKRRKIWDLKTVKGYTDEQIAAEMKLTQSEVTSCLNILGSEYLTRIDRQAIGYKMQQVAQLENIIKEALEAWEWSKYHKVQKYGPIQEARAALREANGEDPIRVRAGNPAYLKVAMEAMDKIKLLLNLGATHIIRSEVDQIQEELNNYSIEELQRIVHGQYTIVDAESRGTLSPGTSAEGEGDLS